MDLICWVSLSTVNGVSVDAYRLLYKSILLCIENSVCVSVLNRTPSSIGIVLINTVTNIQIIVHYIQYHCGGFFASVRGAS